MTVLTQNFHDGALEYYTDSTFVNDGVDIKIMSHGGSATVWDIIYLVYKEHKTLV